MASHSIVSTRVLQAYYLMTVLCLGNQYFSAVLVKYLVSSVSSELELKGSLLCLPGLLKWVLAMMNYYGVARTVEPKRRKVAEAEKNLRIAQKDLATTKSELISLSTQLEMLRQQFSEKTAEQQDLKEKVTPRAAPHSFIPATDVCQSLPACSPCWPLCVGHLIMPL
jgi:Microtubule-binding stalk of dynein motor